MHISEIDTPALVVDLDIFERNLARVADYAREHSLRLRPHTKTHKSVRIAGRQIARRRRADRRQGRRSRSHAGRRARRFAGGLPHHRPHQARTSHAGRAPHARHGGARQHFRRAPAFRRRARRAGEIGVLAEVDVGLGRVGVAPGEPLLQLAQAIQKLPHLRFDGIAFYPGHIKSLDESGLHALAQLCDLVRGILDDFRAAGIEIGSSAAAPRPRSSTPTKCTG